MAVSGSYCRCKLYLCILAPLAEVTMIADLIYTGNEHDYAEIQALISQKYPMATFEDGSDEVHPYRFSIEIPTDVPTEDDYFLWLILTGLINVSLALNLVLMGDLPRARRLLDQVKAARAIPKE
jgi:hypothetical protein